MKTIIKAFTGYTGMSDSSFGKSVDEAIHRSFIGKVSVPLQVVVGKVVAVLNRKGLVINNVLTGHNMDAQLAENKHSELVEIVINEILEYLTGYGSVITNRTNNKGKWTTHWILTLDTGIFRLMEKEDKGFQGASLKKLRKLAVQSLFIDKLGVNTKVERVDAEYLEGINAQYVEFKLNKVELANHITETYSESVLMATGKVKYTRTPRTKGLVESHTACLEKLDGKFFPINETLEPRGRTAKQQQSMLGMNLYGKTWETQSFHLGEETVAWDARQSGYQILGAVLGSKPLCEITGVYGQGNGGDIYTEAFAFVLARVFDGQSVPRSVAKKPAQMLAYMAGMASILTEDDDNQGSIWSRLAPEGAVMEDYCKALEIELWEESILVPIMELRQEVRDGHFANYAAPTWSFPDTSEYFFTRSDTSFISFFGKEAPIFMIKGDTGKYHQMTMHISIIRELAKSSAILAAIIHSLDALLKKLVAIDVWSAGGKIVIKHDEFIVNKEYEEVMMESYHRWLAHFADHRDEYLAQPLEQCGYAINLDAMVKRNETRYGKFYPFMVKVARNGLKYEWTISSK